MPKYNDFDLDLQTITTNTMNKLDFNLNYRSNKYTREKSKTYCLCETHNQICFDPSTYTPCEIK